MFAKQLPIMLQTTILEGRIADYIASLGLPGGANVEAVVVLVVVTLVLIATGRLLLIRGVKHFLELREVDRHLQLMVLRAIYILVVAISLGAGLYTSGYTFLLGALLAGLAAGGLSFGFALQGAVRNVVAGLFLYAEKPFRVGDEIEWEGGNAGTVEDIQLRVTRIRSFDNKTVTVPNAKLTEGVTKNPVKDGPLRLELNVPIDLKGDVEEAKRIILDVADGHEQILKDPAPAVNLVEFEESRLLLQSWIWVANHDIGNRVRIRDEFATAVKNRFDEEGIDIPYPRRRISTDPEMKVEK